MKAETIKALQAARAERRAVALVDAASSDAAEARIVYRDESLAGDPLAADAAIVAAARRAMDVGRSETVDAGRRQDLPHRARCRAARLIIVGAVHIAQALAPMATMLGYRRQPSSIRAPPAPPPKRFPDVPVYWPDWPDEALPGDRGLDALRPPSSR